MVRFICIVSHYSYDLLTLHLGVRYFHSEALTLMCVEDATSESGHIGSTMRNVFIHRESLS